MTGTLALLGGTDLVAEAELDRRLFPSGTELLVLPTAKAYENPKAMLARAAEHFARLDVTLKVLDVYARSDAADATMAHELEDCRALYVAGGSPMHLRSVLKDTACLDSVVAHWLDGATVAVAAESTSVLCSHMVDNRGGAFTVGLGLITSMTVISRFDQWSPDKRHRTISLARPDLVVVGIDAGTALLRNTDGSWEAVGDGEVHVFTAGTRRDLDALPGELNPEAGI